MKTLKNHRFLAPKNSKIKKNFKVLVIGDFHGKFPKKFEEIINEKRIDLVVSLGDYPPFHYRKLWFKHCFAKDVELWEVIGKKKYKKLVIKDLKIAEKALIKLNKLSVPVITVLGNIDYPFPNDMADVKNMKKRFLGIKYWKWGEQEYMKIVNLLKKYKNIKRFDYSYVKISDYIFIGARGHSFPGYVKSKAYKKYRAKLEKLFKKFSKENKSRKVIFVSHNSPYKVLDKITSKAADKRVKNKNYGSKMFRRLLLKYQPILAFGGHVHEARGKKKLDKTLVINPGSVHDNEGVIVEVGEERGKGKIKNIRFLR